MRDRLFNIWELLRGSLWFLPALLTLVGIASAQMFLFIDRWFSAPQAFDYLWRGGVVGAREVLSTIATSIIGVAGVAFSITVVALSLAASQYGSLILARYLRDPFNQLVLGIFIGTYVYCLLVLGNVSGEDQEKFVPGISVSFGLVLAVASLAAFIFFIHRLTQSMQGDYLVAGVGQELLKSIEWIFPEELGREPEEAGIEVDVGVKLPIRFESEAWAIPAPAVGYLQTIESERLMQLVIDHDLVIRLNVKPGDFLTQGAPLGMAWSRNKLDRKQVTKEICSYVFVGRGRTPSQDPEYSMLQLSQIAVRALSPGINDPTTALICINWMATALNRLTERRIPSGCRFDSNGTLRIVAPVADFTVTADAAFEPLRTHGRNEARVLIRLMQIAGEVGRNTRRRSDRSVLHRHAQRLYEEGMASLSMHWEKEALEEHYQAALMLLEHHQ